MVLAYLTSLGTKNERMAACMDHMFVPVIHGGLSTLLGQLEFVSCFTYLMQ